MINRIKNNIKIKKFPDTATQPARRLVAQWRPLRQRPAIARPILLHPTAHSGRRRRGGREAHAPRRQSLPPHPASHADGAPAPRTRAARLRVPWQLPPPRRAACRFRTAAPRPRRWTPPAPPRRAPSPQRNLRAPSYSLLNLRTSRHPGGPGDGEANA